MSKQLSLDSFVSGRIARTNPIEKTPEFEAALNGSEFIPDTWGGYATRLMDMRDLEPGESIAALGLTGEQLADPEIQFTFDSYDNPRDFYVNKFYTEALKDLEVEARRLRGIVDVVMSGSMYDDLDAALVESELIQSEIDDGKYEDDEMDLACTARDALDSGVEIAMDEFVVEMLSTNVLNDEYPSELARLWIQTIKDVVEDVCEEYRLDEEVKAHYVVLGRDAFIKMKAWLKPYELARDVAEERWDYLKPVFTARALGEFSLLAGNER